MNTTDTADWDKAFEELQKQKSLRYGLVMDEIFNYMESGEAAIGAYYAGDYFTMKEDQAENVDLKFYYPDPTNYYIDAMCIPSACRNKELAEIFINYMLSEEPAVANGNIFQGIFLSVHFLILTFIPHMGEEAMKVLYPPTDNFAADYNKYAYKNLDAETLDYINTLWEKVKNN